MLVHEKIKKAIELCGSTEDQALYELLVSLREDIAKLREDNIRLQEEVASLRRQISEKQDVLVDRQSIWKKKADGTPEGPYCPSCYGSKQNLVLMTKNPNPAFYSCAICKVPIEIYPERRADEGSRQRHARSSLI